MLFVSMVVIGLIAAFRLPLEAEPEATCAVLLGPCSCRTPAPRRRVERNLMRPVEETIASCRGIKFDERANANADGGGCSRSSPTGARHRDGFVGARERIDAIRDQLPTTSAVTFVAPLGTSDRRQ